MIYNDWIPIKRIFLVSVLVVTVVIGMSLYFSIKDEHQEIYLTAKMEAEASYNKDLQYRRWAALHGGVYVPVTEKTPPNPYLSHIPERDITTPSGKKLTLMNPAYMTRQAHEIQEVQYGVKGHITSLNPIRPENKADEWETKALHEFQKGTKEIYEITTINQEEYMRYMHPMITEKMCLKCHAKQGYKIGDIRGGISTSVPMNKYNLILEHKKYIHFRTHLIIAFCFLIFSFFSYRRIKKEVLKRIHSQKELLKQNKELDQSEQRLKLQNEEYLAINEELTESYSKTQALNEEYISLNEEFSENNAHIQKINEELISAKEKAEESDRLKSAFLANVSHEIRTPMNGIIGFSDLLNSRELSKEKQKTYTEIIKNNSIQLLDIVNDLLDISKIETGQMRLQNGQIKLNSFLTEIFNFFEVKAKQKKIHLLLSIDPVNNNLFITTDGQKLRQIIFNLLSNAIKFTNQGKIQFGYTISSIELEFFVIDSGLGIDKHYHEKIFDRFSQVEVTLNKNKGGTGLGLAICKGFVELLGGKIRIESEISKGSSFYFTIPLIKTESENKYVKQENIKLSFKTETTFLITEDDDNNFIFLKELLQYEKLKIIRAVTGNEAIEMCSVNNDISLVLMDVKLPDLNGYDATRIIKKTRPDLPIIAQTAFAAETDKEKAMEAGCDAYISKPIEIENLKFYIKKFLPDI